MNGTWLDRHRHLVFAILVIITLGGASAFYWWQPANTSIELVATEITPSPDPTLTPTPTPAPVRVYVTGAVANSDVPPLIVELLLAIFPSSASLPVNGDTE